MEEILHEKTENISGLIHLIRGEKIILDSDLARLYEIPTKVLKQAVRRNNDRFPSDFLFILNPDETCNLRSQFVTSSWGGSRYKPFAFTEQGVAMLSSVPKSKKAIHVNIAIMRVFAQLRRFLETHRELSLKIEELERTVMNHDDQIQQVFRAIRELIQKKNEPIEPIGYKLRGK
ncbi:MAG TPA: ORF6N domain-containing protein [Bacteroidales bacterium]|mgnify:CR=1 FL=1|nr:ORF6N domain-containing protein [Bacteroidales bacterium]HPS49389.1 ORF6N domain-containing protein [Bacteroidales bacterium]